MLLGWRVPVPQAFHILLVKGKEFQGSPVIGDGSIASPPFEGNEP